jgi:hypothetical protein
VLVAPPAPVVPVVLEVVEVLEDPDPPQPRAIAAARDRGTKKRARVEEAKVMRLYVR